MAGDHFPGPPCMHNIWPVYCQWRSLWPCGWPPRWLLELAALRSALRMKPNTNVSPAAITQHRSGPKTMSCQSKQTLVCLARMSVNIRRGVGGGVGGGPHLKTFYSLMIWTLLNGVLRRLLRVPAALWSFQLKTTRQGGGQRALNLHSTLTSPIKVN